MPYPASVIAYAFVKKSIDEGKFVTQMKLQKLVYFAHGYHLAKYGDPLIKERFQAWKLGPVVPSLYRAYRGYGSKPIVDTTYVEPIEFSVFKLDERAQDSIDYTWKALQDVSALSLSNWTHRENSPWAKYYKENDLDLVIDNEAIKEYFKQFLSSLPVQN